MRMGDWVNRLAGQTEFDVQGAAELGAAEREQRRDTVFVLYADERAEDNTLVGTVRQRCTVGVAIVLAITNRRDKRGAAALSEIETARAVVMGLLLGWQPPDAHGPVTYRHGRVLDLNRATLWWQDEYEVPVLIQAA